MDRLQHLIDQHLYFNLSQGEEEELDQIIASNEGYMRIFEQAVKDSPCTPPFILRVALYQENTHNADVPSFRIVHYYSVQGVERFHISGRNKSFTVERRPRNDWKEYEWITLIAEISPGKEKYAAYVISSVCGKLNDYIAGYRRKKS